MIDQYDRLQNACDRASDYPTNIIRTQTFSHALYSYRTRLQNEDHRLFESRSEFHLVELLEAYDGDNAFEYTGCKSVENLKTHFQRNRKDPKCRHIFIGAENSRRPLDCSKAMIQYLFSFHQVSPSFLDFVVAFGNDRQPKDFHYTGFRQESFLDETEGSSFAISRLGRSGREIRLCYNLWSAETSSQTEQTWSIRQSAVYHSFDLDTGRACWINIKANDVLQARIKDETANSNWLCAHSLSDRGRCFAATLMTHLLYFEWCQENWRSYLISLERKLDGILQKAYCAPVERFEQAAPVDPDGLIRTLKSVNTMSIRAPSRANSFEKGHALSRKNTGAFTNPRSMLSRSGSTKGLDFSATAQGQLQESQFRTQRPLSTIVDAGSEENEQFDFLRQFSIDGLQQLSRLGSKLQEGSLVMKLCHDVLLEITEYYEDVMKDHQFPPSIEAECQAVIPAFFQRSKSIIKDLEREQCRITTLIHMFENGKTMFESILQFRNVETNKLFALNAHHSAQRIEEMTLDMHQSTIKMEMMTESMHKIAEKTERETASMHIITFVTLIFLPGTFIATFFGSGLFQWDQNNPGAMPTWKPEFFALFAKIAIPLMAGTILLWLGAYWWATRNRKEYVSLDEENQWRDGNTSVEKL